MDSLVRLSLRRARILGLIHMEDRPIEKMIMRIQLSELEAALIELAAGTGQMSGLPKEIGAISPHKEIEAALSALLATP